MFWKSKSPLSPDDEEWQLECWRWLLENFGGIDALSQSALILPKAEFFPGTDATGHAKAQHIFCQVAEHMGISPDEFELVPQEKAIDPKLGGLMVVQNAPASPAGTFQASSDRRLRITYDPAGLDNPSELIATLAHELCHPLLLSTEEKPPGGDDCEEFATDLAVTYFGFGVFGANSAFHFEQYSDLAGGTQGWSTRRQGYLTEAEWGFSLAVFLLLTDQPGDEIYQYLKSSPAGYLKKSLKYIRANMHLIEPLSGRRRV